MKLSDFPRPGTTRFRLRTLRHRIGPLFPDTPEGRLWLGVLVQAAEDVSTYVDGELNSFYAADAHRYLHEPEISACVAAGIDSSYARRVLNQVGILR